MPAGRDSESTPIVTQVERRSSARRTVLDGTRRSPDFVVKTISFALPETGTVRMSFVPGAPNSFATRVAGSTTGPQRWCGDHLSSGSGTETRYGIGVPPLKTSSTSAVRPPDDEKKNVVATFPSNIKTWRARGGDGFVADVGFRIDAAVDLAARVGIEDRRALARLGQRVRARGDGLRLHDLERPIVGNLLAHDAADVGVDADDVHGLQAAVDALNLEVAAVGPVPRARAASSRGGRSMGRAARAAAMRDRSPP